MIVLLSLVIFHQGKKIYEKDSSFDFNCVSECGEYEDGDTDGDILHKECSLIYKKDDCQQNPVSKKSETCDDWCDISNACKPPVIKEGLLEFNLIQ